jgi:hypothetical protein
MAITSGSDPKNKVRQILAGEASGTLDFTGFVEVDISSDITVGANVLTFVIPSDDSNTYVYKDYTAGYFGDINIAFEFEESNSDVADLRPHKAFFCTLSNAIQDWYDDLTETQIAAVWQRDSTSNRLCAAESNGGAETIGSGVVVSLGTPYYCTLKRVGTTLTLSVYSDAARETLVGTDVISCLATTFRYLYALQAPDYAAGGSTGDGYLRNMEILHTLQTTVTKDDDVTPASFIICYENDKLSVEEYFTTYDGVVFVSGPQVAYSRYIQDVPAKANYNVIVAITTVDKTGITGSILNWKIQKTMENLIEAAAQMANGTTVTIVGRTRASSFRSGGVTLYTQVYTIDYATT